MSTWSKNPLNSAFRVSSQGHFTVTRHENQRVDLTLKGHAGDIQANAHIDAFLTKPRDRDR
jgi:hypothetical protein